MIYIKKKKKRWEVKTFVASLRGCSQSKWAFIDEHNDAVSQRFSLAFLTQYLVIFLRIEFFPVLFSRHRGLRFLLSISCFSVSLCLFSSVFLLWAPFSLLALSDLSSSVSIRWLLGCGSGIKVPSTMSPELAYSGRDQLCSEQLVCSPVDMQLKQANFPKLQL